MPTTILDINAQLRSQIEGARAKLANLEKSKLERELAELQAAIAAESKVRAATPVVAVKAHVRKARTTKTVAKVTTPIAKVTTPIAKPHTRCENGFYTTADGRTHNAAGERFLCWACKKS